MSTNYDDSTAGIHSSSGHMLEDDEIGEAPPSNSSGGVVIEGQTIIDHHAASNKPPNEDGHDDVPYSALSEREKKTLLILASFAAVISPFSSSVYYPSINSLAKDLDVSVSLINLTISTYQIFQGAAPSVTAAFSDTYGRRPAYLACFIVYFGANLGLAMQRNYVALLVFRCLQSCGSSGTVALAQALVADLSTPSERGKYTAYAAIGYSLGPAVGPVIGGLLSQYLGWRAIFWFLVILCTVMGIIILVCVRETSRSAVGNGSCPPPRWNRSLCQLVREPKEWAEARYDTIEDRCTRVNPFIALQILADKESAIICFHAGFLFAGYTSVSTILSSQLHRRYGLDPIHIGLCYLPIGFGTLLSRWTVAKGVDWTFKQEADKQGFNVSENRHQDITNFNIEKARLFMAFPLILIGCCLLVGYGWLMEYQTSLAPILVVLFLLANVLTGTLIPYATLLTDINRDRAAASAAAFNLFRCWLSAGGIAASTPLIDAIGIGATASMTAGLWLVMLPSLWFVYRYGHRWRLQRIAKRQQNDNTEAAAGNKDTTSGTVTSRLCYKGGSDAEVPVSDRV